MRHYGGAKRSQADSHINGMGDCAFAKDVRVDEHRSVPNLFSERLPLFNVHVCNDDADPTLCQPARRSAAQAPRASRDNGRRIGKFHIASPQA